MIILVDGYNLIKQALNVKHIAPDDKLKFLHRLSNYARKKNLQLHVIFDGYDDNDNFSSRHLKVSYSGYKESADKFIENLAWNVKGDALLVSSDKELCNFVEEDSKFEYMDSLEFYAFLKKSEVEDAQDVYRNDHFASARDIIKISKNEDQELDQLMAQDFGLEMKLEDFVKSDCGLPRHKPTKNEKRILNKIKKL